MPKSLENSGNLAPQTDSMYRPFVDFYSENNIAPVRQNISDLQQHFDRREALYRHLGIAPSLVSGKSIVEFGPGSGHNAIYTTSLHPARYLLVDANASSLEQTRQTLASHAERSGIHEVAASYIEEYESEERFDIVLCEGVIPFQRDPGAFARRVSRFVKPGGIFVLTTIDGISFLGESTRRLIASTIVDFKAPTSEKLKILRPIFEPHLATMKSMSRHVDDWLYDNILIPYAGRLFSIRDAIDALDASFDIYGLSPNFLTDHRWYKSIHGENRLYNARGMQQYLHNVANLIDYRMDGVSLPPSVGEQLLNASEDLFYSMIEMENTGSQDKLLHTVATLRKIIAIIAPASPRTAQSLIEVANYLETPSHSPTAAFDDFRSFFGRGQQYVSFIKRK